MTNERRFAAFSRTAVLPRMNEIPEAGFCISAFIVLSKIGNPDEVVMGHLNPETDWNHIGALDHERAERNSKGWMLPSCHLLIEESPDDAARRILKEQLGVEDQKLMRPEVFSEAYSSGKVWETAPLNHWDLQFIFQGEISSLNQHPAWKDLAFVDLRATKKSDMARFHEDILAHVGRWRSTE
jgi:ADP-ribose pyrophosphatase YjhB (NUDIX family)